jgi:hypothetical protein
MNRPADIPTERQRLIDSELYRDERVTWSAQPLPGRMARKAWPTLLFGLPWTAFAVFWVIMASRGIRGAGPSGMFSLFFPLFGVPFILIGIVLLSSPWWLRRQATRTAYVLTNQRAIILSRGWFGRLSVRSFAPEGLTDLRRNQSPDGSGGLIFTQGIRRNNDYNYLISVGFLGVDHVKSVEEQIRALIARQRTGQD